MTAMQRRTLQLELGTTGNISKSSNNVKLESDLRVTHLAYSRILNNIQQNLI